MLRRDGWAVNSKRIYRVYKELGLQLSKKVPKRWVKVKLRDDRRVATRTNEIWAVSYPAGDAKHRRKGILYTANSPQDAI